MVEAATTAVPITTIDEVDISELLDWRARSNAAASDVRLTLLPFIMKAVVAALKQHPALNASLAEDQQHLILKRYYHLGIATDTPEGLIVPVVKDVDRKSLLTLATEVQQLAELANTRRIPLADLRGGTFTISNYGAVGGIFATPMLHLPQVAILGVGRFMQKPVAYEGAVALAHRPAPVPDVRPPCPRRRRSATVSQRSHGLSRRPHTATADAVMGRDRPC